MIGSLFCLSKAGPKRGARPRAATPDGTAAPVGAAARAGGEDAVEVSTPVEVEGLASTLEEELEGILVTPLASLYLTPTSY